MTVGSLQEATPERIITAITNGGIQDPFPLYNELRERDTGVHWAAELGGWLCTRYDDIRRIYSDDASFSNVGWFDSITPTEEPARADYERFMSISSQQFMLTDPPTHTEIRSMLRGAFTPRAVQRWRGATLQATEAALDDLDPLHEQDVMAEFAPRIPIAVIAALLGIQDEDTGRIRDWTNGFVDTFDPTIVGYDRDDRISTALDLFDYLAVQVQNRRAHRADDLITLVATADINGDPMTISRAIAQLALLLAAGNETTTNLIGDGITLLIQNPHIKMRLREEPRLIPAAVEEMLRLDPPFHLIRRKVIKPITIGGRQLEPGQFCWQLLAAANRDPRNFHLPNRFKLVKRPHAHLSFITGTHFCLGAALARMEGQVVFSTLLERYPHFSAGDDPAVRKTDVITSRGWLTRPVKLIPATPPDGWRILRTVAP